MSEDAGFFKVCFWGFLGAFFGWVFSGTNCIIYLAPETGTGSEAGVMTGSEAGVVTGSEAGVVAGSKAGVVTGSKAGVVTRSRKPAAAENQKQRWTITNLPGK